MLPRKRPIHAGSSAVISETPKGRGLPGSRCGRIATVDVRTQQTFSTPRAAAALSSPSIVVATIQTPHTDAAALNAPCRQTPAATEQAPSPRETGIFGEPARKRPIDAGSSAALSETPKGRGLPGSRCGRTATADVRTPQTFNLPRTDAAALNAQCRQRPAATEQAPNPA